MLCSAFSPYIVPLVHTTRTVAPFTPHRRGTAPWRAVAKRARAAARGRVVLFTGLGIVAAVDARTGRPCWAYRNDRGVVGAGRLKRLQGEHDRSARETGFANVPPLLAYERVYEGEHAIVVINTHASKTSSTSVDGQTMTVSAAPGTTFRDALPNDTARSYTVQSDGTLLVELGPREAVVLVP